MLTNLLLHALKSQLADGSQLKSILLILSLKNFHEGEQLGATVRSEKSQKSQRTCAEANKQAAVILQHNSLPVNAF